MYRSCIRPSLVPCVCVVLADRGIGRKFDPPHNFCSTLCRGFFMDLVWCTECLPPILSWFHVCCCIRQFFTVYWSVIFLWHILVSGTHIAVVLPPQVVQWLRLALTKGGVFLPFYLRTEACPVSETSCYLVILDFRTMDKVHNPISSWLNLICYRDGYLMGQLFWFVFGCALFTSRVAHRIIWRGCSLCFSMRIYRKELDIRPRPIPNKSFHIYRKKSCSQNSTLNYFWKLHVVKLTSYLL
jgi:hypothetical protein